jgi:hypothetical protein
MGFYQGQEKVVRETWAKDILDEKYKNIKFLSYTSNSESIPKIDDGTHLYCDTDNDGIWSTYDKTYKAFKLIKNLDFDYIFRTNTSTVVNVRLLNAFVQSLENDEVLWTSEIYSSEKVVCPLPSMNYGRGNGLLISRKLFDVILDLGKYSQMDNKIGYADDNVIGNIINTYHMLKYNNSSDYVRPFTHRWYKSLLEHHNGPSEWKNANSSWGTLFPYITIQIRNYYNRKYENDSIRLIAKELDKIPSFRNEVYNAYTQQIKESSTKIKIYLVEKQTYKDGNLNQIKL